jgi:hypothetical protein
MPVLTKERAVKDFRRLKKKLGRRPTGREYVAHCHSYHMVRRAFGERGWTSLLAAAGERMPPPPPSSKEEILRSYHALKKKLGHQPTCVEYKNEYWGTGVLGRYFGRPVWRSMLHAAGVEPVHLLNISRAHLAQDFRTLEKKLGRQPLLAEFMEHCHTPKVLDRVFGKPGWKNFLKSLGTRIVRKRALDKEHLFRDYYEIRGVLKREPLQEEFRLRHMHTAKVFDRLFGRPGWSNFQRAALAWKKRSA